MKNIKYIAFTVAALLLLPLLGGAGAVAYMQYGPCGPGSLCVVGDIRTFNNDPFSDFNTAIAEDPTLLLDGSAGTIVFEGATLDASELTLAVTDPTADRTITLPDASVNVGRIRVTCTMLLIADMVDQSCFVADRVYTLISINAVWKVQESGGTLTVLTRKQEGTEAAASGQLLQASAMNVVATAETVTTPTLSSTGADLIFAAGDRIGIDFTDDTAGELAGLVITFVLDPS